MTCSVLLANFRRRCRLEQRGRVGPPGSGLSWAAAAALAALLAGGQARAAEPRSSSEPDVLREPASVLRVADAWGEAGGIDLHFTLGYQHAWKRAAILRESQGAAAPGASTLRPVADHAEDTSRLNVRAELGLYQDLALTVRVPIVLSSSSTLGVRGAVAGALEGAPGEPLFALPFASPNRSGVELLGLGLRWAVLNQARDAYQPSLLVAVEGRFSVSEPKHACGPAPGGAGAGTRCAYPADIDRDGAGGGFPVSLPDGSTTSLEGELPSEPRGAGVSRGTTALDVQVAISRRFAQLEPYFVFGALLERPDADSDFGAGPWREGPPLEGRASIGAELIAWELIEQFQRFSLDLRLTGTYRSRGQDYSELFDALGSSGASTFRRPSFAGYRENPNPAERAVWPSVVDPASERVFPTGLTQVAAHGAYALRLGGRWQAGRYVHFDAGGALSVTGRHFISLGRPCDASRQIEREQAGPCALDSGALGAPDPSYRPEIDAPGQRFLVDTARSIDAWVGATVLF